MLTRVNAVNNLKRYINKDLYELACQHGITVVKNGKQNKGWKGSTLEILAGLQNNNSRAPNGLGFELKSTAFYKPARKNIWVPKETMAITMINPDELRRDEFYDSHCWKKLKSLIYCAVSWHGTNNCNSMLLAVQSFDFLRDKKLVDELEEDYNFIRNKFLTKGFSVLTGKDGKWIQARTKGAGHGTTSRAFYARKKLINEIFSSCSFSYPQGDC